MAERRKGESQESWARRQREDAQRRRANPEVHAKVLAQQAARYRRKHPGLPPYTPRPPRGPTDPTPPVPPMHEGHELAGVSTLTGPDGETRGAWNKTRVAGADEPPVPVPDTMHLQRTSLMQRGDGTVVVQWNSYDQAARDRHEAIKAAITEHVATYVPPASPLHSIAGEALTPDAFHQLVGTSDDLLVVYPLGDPHIGMLAWAPEVGEHFDLRIAERELCECMVQLVARAPASRECVVANLGDFWHAQDDRQVTPKSGHKLDVDGRYGKVAKIGLSILQRLVDTALAKHALVRMRSIPGNHDPITSVWLTQYLGAWYRNEPRVVIEASDNPYQFDVHGRVLLGWAHGDGAKIEQLGEIMATDEPERWGAARFRYWNTGHVHHLSERELRGCVVSTHRTLAGRDAWHHHSGYRSGRSLKGIAYHREWGRDSEWMVGVERVRAAIERRAA